MRNWFKAAIGIFFFLAFNLPAFSQSAAPSRTLTKIDLPNEPVKIVCQHYGDDAEWLKDLAIDVENIAGRPILDLECDLIIRKPSRVATPILIPIKFDRSILEPGETPATRLIKVGAIATLKVQPGDYNKAKETYRDAIDWENLNHAEILIRYASYGNGSGWFKGSDLLLNNSKIVAEELATTELNSCNDFYKAKQLTVVGPVNGDDIVEPIEIVELNYRQENDWLRDAAITVVNRSRRPISYLECSIIFCDIKESRDCISIPLVFDSEQSAALPPGGIAQLRVSEPAYQEARRLIERYLPISAVNRADLIISQVKFNSGMTWFNESLLSTSSWSLHHGSAYLTPKASYVWGYLRDRDQVFYDIYGDRGFFANEPENHDMALADNFVKDLFSGDFNLSRWFYYAVPGFIGINVIKRHNHVPAKNPLEDENNYPRNNYPRNNYPRNNYPRRQLVVGPAR